MRYQYYQPDAHGIAQAYDQADNQSLQSSASYLTSLNNKTPMTFDTLQAQQAGVAGFAAVPLMTPQHSRESSSAGVPARGEPVMPVNGNVMAAGATQTGMQRHQQQVKAQTAHNPTIVNEPLPILDSHHLQLILAQPINIVQFPTSFGEILAAVSAYGGWQRVHQNALWSSVCAYIGIPAACPPVSIDNLCGSGLRHHTTSSGDVLAHIYITNIRAQESTVVRSIVRHSLLPHNRNGGSSSSKSNGSSKQKQAATGRDVHAEGNKGTGMQLSHTQPINGTSRAVDMRMNKTASGSGHKAHASRLSPTHGPSITTTSGPVVGWSTDVPAGQRDDEQSDDEPEIMEVELPTAPKQKKRKMMHGAPDPSSLRPCLPIRKGTKAMPKRGKEIAMPADAVPVPRRNSVQHEQQTSQSGPSSVPQSGSGTAQRSTVQQAVISAPTTQVNAFASSSFSFSTGPHIQGYAQPTTAVATDSKAHQAAPQADASASVVGEMTDEDFQALLQSFNDPVEKVKNMEADAGLAGADLAVLNEQIMMPASWGQQTTAVPVQNALQIQNAAAAVPQTIGNNGNNSMQVSVEAENEANEFTWDGAAFDEDMFKMFIDNMDDNARDILMAA